MIAFEEYLNHVLQQITPLPVETVTIGEAQNRTLAQDLKVRYAVPPFDNSAMDGFAFRHQDLVGETVPHGADGQNCSAAAEGTDAEQSELASLGARGQDSEHTAPSSIDSCCAERAAEQSEGHWTLPVCGDIAAGDTSNFVLQPGTACRIMTGAPLPVGADTVIMVEDTNIPPGPQPLPETITFHQLPSRGSNVRYCGEDAKIGDIVLPAGEILAPAALASAVSVGYRELPVYRQPRVAVISTGDELKPAGEPLGPGQIPDSNSWLIAALLEKEAVQVTRISSSSDDPECFRDTLYRAVADADLVITSGGVSAGAYDVVKQVARENQVSFQRVAMQPGKPQGFGRVSTPEGAEAYLATLPGNPVSVFVSFNLFVRPILAALQGQDPYRKLRRRAALTRQAWSSIPGKTQFMPVHLEEPTMPGESAIVTPTHRLGSKSHFVASLHLANALAVIPPQITDVAQWSVVEIILT